MLEILPFVCFILALPDWSQSLLLDTDASYTGIGGTNVLTRRELLAVVTFLQHFTPYLLGNPFTIKTNYGALAWLQKFKEPEGQVACWVQKLQEYQLLLRQTS